jgi:hypothetical protein
MCIISAPVESVAKTKILVAPDATGTRQLTVYSNAVDNKSLNNAMLLPVPNPQSVEFHDLSKYKNIFTDCDSSFYKPVSRSWNLSMNSYSLDDSAQKLAVFDVGSYKVSLAMGIKDLKRVDETVFTLSDGCYEMLSQEYSDPVFGFIICKLKTGREEYHPMGYSHKIHQGKMFIPTKHYHAHGSVNRNSSNFESLSSIKYDISNIDNSPMFANSGLGFTSGNNNWSGFGNYYNSNTQPVITEDWAHEIYLYNGTNKTNAQFKNMSRSNEMWTGEHLIKANLINFNFSQLSHFEKHKIHGHQKNIDLDAIIDLSPNDIKSSKLTEYAF